MAKDETARGIPYVRVAGDANLSPPGKLSQVTYYNFVVEARREALEAFCQRTFARPTGGALDYRPLSDAVVVSFAHIGRLDPGDDDRGWIGYHDIAIWVPLVAVKTLMGVPYADRIVTFPATILVDEPDTLVTGREGYGFPKQRGWFDMPASPEAIDRLTADVWGVRGRGPDERMQRLRLWEVRRDADDPTAASSPWADAAEAARAFLGLLDPHELPRVFPALDPLAFFREGIPLLGVRQLRDVTDPTRATYLDVVESPARLAAFHRGGLLTDDYTFTLEDLRSHPVAAQLGLQVGAQPVRAAFWMVVDFELGGGKTLWRSRGTTVAEPAPATRSRGGPPAQASLASVASLPQALEWVRLPRSRPPAPRPRRVAILGGGLAALTAAHQLSDPRLQGRFELTVYQMGWRLGGKGASGRNPDYHQRIEEHGLHVWFGFYENAFAVARSLYEELDRPAGAPLRTWQDAFKPHDFVAVNELHEGRWIPWRLDFPPNNHVPGATGEVLPDVWDVALMAAGWLLEGFETLIDAGELSLFDALEEHLVEAAGIARELFGGLSAGLEQALLAPASGYLRLARQLADRVARVPGRVRERAQEALFCRLIEGFREWIRPLLGPHLETHDDLRKYWFILDTGTSILLGIFRDDLPEKGLSSIDDLDLSEWMGRHGLEARTARQAPCVRFIYNAAFAYLGGDPERPNLAAGAGLRGVLRMLFTYKGALLYKMQAGMGDVVFTPFYEVLQRRGVRFEMFHAVEKLELSEDRTSIERVRVARQCRAAADYPYLVDVDGLPCWPSWPSWEHIEDGERLRAICAAEGIDLEQVARPPGWPVEERTLVRGEDFDEVLLGISVGGLKPLTEELSAASSRWAEMLEHVQTVRTQAFQLWLKPDLQSLGWRDPRPIFGTYVEPIDTYAEMSYLLAVEQWPVAEWAPQTIAYFVGVQKDVPGESHQEADARAKRDALEYVERDSAYIWPAIAQEGPIDWDLLADPMHRSGKERFDGQYWRANTYGSERYVLSPQGSIKYRLRADESGFSNLTLTGDWIDNDFNTGAVEGTVISGLQAARALAGIELHIVGEDDAWLRGRHAEPVAPPRPTYANVAPLVARKRRDDAALHVLFRCPLSRQEVESCAVLPRPQGAPPPRRPTLRRLRGAVAGLIGRALGGDGPAGWLGHLVSESIAPPPARELDPVVLEAAVVEAFELVMGEFRWDHQQDRWLAAGARRNEAVDPLERQLVGAPIVASADRDLLVRMLVAVASVDGRLTGEEWGVLADPALHDLNLGALSEVARAELSRADLSAASPGSVRETMLMVTWGLALVNLSDAERQLVGRFAEWLEIAPARSGELQETMRRHLVERAILRAPGEERGELEEEAQAFAAALGLS